MPCKFDLMLLSVNDDSIRLLPLQGHTQVCFVSTLLQITMSDQLDLPVRQAGESKPQLKPWSRFGQIVMQGESLRSEHSFSYTLLCIHKGVGTAIGCHFMTIAHWPLVIVLIVRLRPAKRLVFLLLFFFKIRMKWKGFFYF